MKKKHKTTKLKIPEEYIGRTAPELANKPESTDKP